MSQNKNLKRNATFTIAEVALDICLPVARKRRVTAKRSLLQIACLMTHRHFEHARIISTIYFFFLKCFKLLSPVPFLLIFLNHAY